MVHPLVQQLRFTRHEWLRALDGVTDAEARQRFLPMNAISWNIGHLAWQEQRYWLQRLQEKVLLTALNEQFCNGCPGIAPPLEEMRQAWHTVVAAADPFLDTITTEELVKPIAVSTPQDGTFYVTAGNLMQRIIYHYWYHTGENMAIRQLLGHTSLPEFVGNIDDEAPYAPVGV